MRLLVATGYPGVCDLDWRSCWLQLFWPSRSLWLRLEMVHFVHAPRWRVWPSRSLWLRLDTKLFLAAALWRVWPYRSLWLRLEMVLFVTAPRWLVWPSRSLWLKLEIMLSLAAALWRVWPSQILWLRLECTFFRCISLTNLTIPEWLRFYTKLFLAAALWQVWKTSWNRQKRASSVFLSLSSNAHACQTRDWKFESPLKKIWHSSTNNVHFKSLHFLHVTFLGSRLCFGPLFQVSVQRFAFLSENKSCRII